MPDAPAQRAAADAPAAGIAPTTVATDAVFADGVPGLRRGRHPSQERRSGLQQGRRQPDRPLRAPEPQRRDGRGRHQRDDAAAARRALCRLRRDGCRHVHGRVLQVLPRPWQLLRHLRERRGRHAVRQRGDRRPRRLLLALAAAVAPEPALCAARPSSGTARRTPAKGAVASVAAVSARRRTDTAAAVAVFARRQQRGHQQWQWMRCRARADELPVREGCDRPWWHLGRRGRPHKRRRGTAGLLLCAHL